MVTTNERSPMAASISAVAATCAKAPTITQGPEREPGPRQRRAGRDEQADKEDERERKAEQKAHMRGADRAEGPGQLALRRVAHGLRERRDDGEDGPQPGCSHRLFSRPSSPAAAQSRRLLRGHHVVHVHVRRQLPAVGEQVIDHAGLADHAQPALLERDLEFVRGHELFPLMGAARQPAQDVFGADDRQRKALHACD